MEERETCVQCRDNPRYVHNCDDPSTYSNPYLYEEHTPRCISGEEKCH